MLLSTLFLVLVGASLTSVQAGHVLEGPVVDLPYGQFEGYNNQTSSLTYFLGMPYAAAPVGPLRFNVPHPPTSFSGVRNATGYGAACIQQPSSTPSGPPLVLAGVASTPANQSEDCLFVNVIKPSNIPSDTQLPVLFWIYGGGFGTGDSAQTDGALFVQRSVELGEPIVYVSINYRLNAYGFLASKEIKDAGVGNMGLRDQRYALEWVQQHIHIFGGDKEKVTIWGESAGADSIGYHLVLNDGNTDGLFRGAFMNSGGPPSIGDITEGQTYYDILISGTGCENASDTLDCLRGVPQENITDVVIHKTPNFLSIQSLQLAYLPRVDGVFLKENPHDSIEKGAYAKVPLVSGNCLDEGTLFSTTQNLTTSDELLDYMHKNYFPRANATDIEEIGRLYPDDPTQGSPFGTDNAPNINIYPQYKRLAAIQGDFFQSHRRHLLTAAAKTQNVWSFNFRRTDSGAPPLLGKHHASDALSFGFLGPTRDLQGVDAVLNFVGNLSPTREDTNSSLSSVVWPTYGTSRSSLTFWDPMVLNMTADVQREKAINGLTTLLGKFPFGFTELPVN